MSLNATNAYGSNIVTKVGYINIITTTNKIGVFRNNHDWYLDYNGNGMWDGQLYRPAVCTGKSRDIPVVGDWNGNGITEIGVFRDNHTWNVDYNGNGVWDGVRRWR